MASLPDHRLIRSTTTDAAKTLREKLKADASAAKRATFEPEPDDVKVVARKMPYRMRGNDVQRWLDLGLGANVRIGETRYGALFCECTKFQNRTLGRLQMCDHISEVIERELDAKAGIPGMVKVPIFRKPGVMMTVHLEPKFNKLGMKSVTMPSDSGQHIGFITESQGRKTLRSLVLEWAAAYDFGTLDCTAVHHTGPRNMVAPERDRIVRLADICCYFENGGCCLVCLDSDGIPEL